MELTVNGHDNQALPLAEELPMEVILREMHRFSHDAGDESLDHQQSCDAWLRSLDAALQRLETDAR